MAITLIDTHCHLDFRAFDDDREAVIERAAEAGVTRMVVPAVDIRSSRRVLDLADRYSAIYAAVGVHPNDVPRDRMLDETIHTLRELAQHPKVVAIGEIGLDYHWKKTPPNTQHQWLVAQLDLAAELGLPVIFHNREATDDTISLLTAWINKGIPAELQNRAGVLHSISTAWEDAKAALELGFYLGFTGPITYKKADEMRRVAANAPANRILIETDAPFLSPQPHRGARNEPAYVRYVAEKVAETRGIDLETACQQTSENAGCLFGWNVA